MTTTEHATWSLERTSPASPTQVFAAWASADPRTDPTPSTPQQRRGGVDTHLDHLGRVLADDDALGQEHP